MDFKSWAIVINASRKRGVCKKFGYLCVEEEVLEENILCDDRGFNRAET
jgi:hypothetical protein